MHHFEVISTDKAPAAVGPYSQAIRAGNQVYTAGQIALDPATGQLVEGDVATQGDVAAQTEQVIANLSAILEAALRLPEPQRAELAERLLVSLTDVDEERLPEGTEGSALLGPGWLEEIERRWEAYRRGEVTPVDGEEFFRELLAKRSP